MLLFLFFKTLNSCCNDFMNTQGQATARERSVLRFVICSCPAHFFNLQVKKSHAKHDVEHKEHAIFILLLNNHEPQIIKVFITVGYSLNNSYLRVNPLGKDVWITAPQRIPYIRFPSRNLYEKICKLRNMNGFLLLIQLAKRISRMWELGSVNIRLNSSRNSNVSRWM